MKSSATRKYSNTNFFCDTPKHQHVRVFFLILAVDIEKLRFFKFFRKYLKQLFLVVWQSYGAHSIDFWQHVSNKTKYWRKPRFLITIFAHKGFTQQRISQNLWQNTKNRFFTGYDWYFLGTLKVSGKFYFVPDWKYCKLPTFWGP